ncbi:MAG: lactonase family protein [Bryobacterales bacterium]|nr:lactonase family protein [Bryobacterales bacterium]
MFSRRTFVGLAGAGILAGKPAAGKFRVYVGTYTRGESKGIYSFVLDTAAGTLTPEGVAGETENPSFLAIHPSGDYLYSCGELDKFQGQASGSLTAFKIDAASGKLEKLNDVVAGGTSTCHVNISRNGRFAVLANYGTGSCAAFAIGPDGRLGERTAYHQHSGTSADPGRQRGPHAHSVNLDKQNKHVIVADLGLDQVKVYKFNAATGAMTPNEPAFTTVKPGSGPRHFTFHPSGKYAYVINEMACTVTAFHWNAKLGTLKEIETVTTLPVPVQKGYSTAEVVAHSNGRFVYGSNRGHNTIAVFQVDAATGKLTTVEHKSTQGEIPRNFAIDPTGQYLIAANQNTHSIVLFRINQISGALEQVGAPIKAPSPVCVRYVKLRRA